MIAAITIFPRGEAVFLPYLTNIRYGHSGSSSGHLIPRQTMAMEKIMINKRGARVVLFDRCCGREGGAITVICHVFSFQLGILVKVDAAGRVPGQPSVISRCIHDLRGRRPSPADSPCAFGLFELRVHRQATESDRSLFGLPPSYGIRNDPLPASPHSALHGDRRTTGLMTFGRLVGWSG